MICNSYHRRESDEIQAHHFKVENLLFLWQNQWQFDTFTPLAFTMLLIQ